jgi:hypothetical protein
MGLIGSELGPVIEYCDKHFATVKVGNFFTAGPTGPAV